MLGNIVYLHMYKLAETLSIKQELDKNRFVRIIEEIPVSGGKENEQYMQYKAQSLFSDKVYTINNYLSSFNFTSINELEMVIDYIEPILESNRLKTMLSIIEEVKHINDPQ